MKNCLLFFGVLFAFNGVGQNDTVDIKPNYVLTIDSILRTYKYPQQNTRCSWNYPFNKTRRDSLKNRKYSKIISPDVNNENLHKAFNTVAFSSSNLVNSTSAFGFTTNEEGTSVSASIDLLAVDRAAQQLYFTLGFNASGSSNVFNFYNNESWQRGAGLSGGFIWKLGGASYFDTKSYTNTRFTKDSSARRSFMIYPAEKYTDALLISKKALLKELESYQLKTLELDSLSDSAKEMLKVIGLEASVKRLTSEVKDMESYKKAFGFTDTDSLEIRSESKASQVRQKPTEVPYEKYIKNRLAEFDKTIDPTYGYWFHWISGNISFNNTTYSFDEEDIDSTARTAYFSSPFKLIPKYNHLTATASLGYNITLNKKKMIYFGSAGFTYYRSATAVPNFFEEDPRIYEDELVIRNEKGRSLGTLSTLESQAVNFGSFNLYSAWFLGEKKTAGINFTFNHFYDLSKNIDNYNFENHFTFLVGPIFRRIKDDNTSLTFGIDVGFENTVYDKEFIDDFTARIRVGIPFTVYKQKTSK